MNTDTTIADELDEPEAPARRDRPVKAQPAEPVPPEINAAFLEDLAFERAISIASALAAVFEMTRAHDALSPALDHLDLDDAPLAYMRVAEMLRPLAAAVVTEAFDEAVAKAAPDKEALDLFRERMVKLYTCRLTELAFIRLAPLPPRQLNG